MVSKKEIAIGVMGFVAGTALAGTRAATATSGWPNGIDKIYRTPTSPDQFKQVLDRIKIKIFPAQWSITTPFFWRDMRDQPWTNGMEYYGKSSLPWYATAIRIDDAEIADQIDAKNDVSFGMYYASTNVDNIPNWGADTPIMGIDSAFFGMFNKQIYIDGRLVRTYRPDPNTWLSGQAFWIRGTKTDGVDDFIQPLDVWPPIPMSQVAAVPTRVKSKMFLSKF